MKGSANCCLDHVEWFCHSGPTKKYGGWIKNRRGGAPGGARARSQEHATSLTRRQLVTEAPTGAPLPRACEGEEKRGTAPRLAHNRGRWRTPSCQGCAVALFDM